MSTSKKLYGEINYNREFFKAQLTLDGIEVRGFYGFRGQMEAATSSFEVFFTSTDPNITAKNFKFGAQAKIDLNFKVIGKNTIDTFSYQLVREVLDIENLQRNLAKDDYCYRLVIGDSTSPLKALKRPNIKTYFGNAAEVIKAICLDRGIPEQQIDVTKIQNIGIKRYYPLSGNPWHYIRDSILRPNGLVVFLTEANQLVFAAKATDIYQETAYPTVGTPKPYNPTVVPTTNFVRNITGIFNFREVEAMLDPSGVEIYAGSIASLMSRQQFQGGFNGKSDAPTAIYHLPGSSSEALSALAQRLHQHMPATYSGEASFPLRLADTMNLAWENVTKQTRITPLVFTSFSEIVCSFFMAPPTNNPAAIDHSAWTGLPPQTMRWKFTALPKDYVPYLEYMDQAPLSMDGVIVGADGKLDSTQATFKGNQLYVGLLSLPRKTPMEQFPTNQVLVADCYEPFVLQNSAPFPGRAIKVEFDPRDGTFSIGEGAYRTVTHSDVTKLQTVNPKAKLPIPAITVTDGLQTVEVKTDDNSSAKLTKEALTVATAQVTANAAQAITLQTTTKNKEANITLGATGIEVNTKEDIKVFGKNLTQAITQQHSTFAKDMQENVTGTLETTAGTIDAQALKKLDMIGAQAKINATVPGVGAPTRAPKPAPKAAPAA